MNDSSKLKDRFRNLREQAEAYLESTEEGGGEINDAKARNLVHELNVYQVELEMQNEELARAQHDLERSRNRFVQLFDFAPTGYFGFDREGVIREVNLTGARMLGVDRAYLLGKPFMTYVETRDQNVFYLHRMTAFESEEPASCSLALRSREGRTVHTKCLSRRMPDPEEGESLCFSALTDVTDLREAQQELERSHRQLSSILENSLSAVLVKDMDGRILSLNPAAGRMFGVSEEVAVGRTPRELLPTSMADKLAEFDRRVVDRGRTLQEEWTLELDGERRDFLVNGFPLYGPDQAPFALCAIVTDISASRKGEEQRRFLASIVESTDDAVIGKTPGGEIISWNRGAETMFGYMAREVLGKNESILVPEEKRGEHHNLLERLKLGKRVYRHESERVRKDGSHIYVTLSMSPIRDDSGRVVATSTIARDSTARIRAVMALAESESKHRAMFEQAAEGILLLDAGGEVLDANPVAVETLGVRLHALRGREFAGFIAGGGKRLSYATLNDGLPMRLDRRLIGPRGELSVDLSMRRVDDERILVMFRDMSERKRMEEELVRAKTAAEAASRTKSEFLANMSHEIRTPISGIIGMSEMTMTMDIPGKARDYLGMILESGRSLLDIINEILDFSKIEANKLSIEKTDFRLDDLLERVLSPLRLAAGKKGLELELSVDPAVPNDLQGDAGRLGQVIRNLVDNAIKFTDHGRIQIFVHRRQAPDGQLCLAFEIVDEGIGITREDQKRLFQSFSQLDSSYSKKYGGTGLGLAISRELVRMMGGEIGVESEPGRGATFHFRVLLEPARNAVPTVEPEQPSETPTVDRSLRVLLVEDDHLNQTFVSHFLVTAGHEVMVAENGLRALELLDNGRFDIVFMDVQMPDMDGVEATRRIRQGETGPGNADIPIVALTAYAMKGDRERFMGAGMDDYVTKPVDMEDLYAAMNRFTAERSAAMRFLAQSAGSGSEAPEQELSAPSSVLVEQAEPVQPSIDYEELLQRVRHNESLMRRMLIVFLDDAPRVMRRLDVSLAAEDLDDVADIAHSVVNMTGAIRAHGAADVAKRLEMAASEADLDRSKNLAEELAAEMDRVVASISEAYPEATPVAGADQDAAAGSG